MLLSMTVRMSFLKLFRIAIERPKAFRKLWHGVSMFELVRKPCSLNFGMLGLFGMIGMTLLLAAVFAFGAFGIQGNDGQFDAYGREWCTKGARAEWHADGARGEWGTECAGAEWDGDGSRGEWHNQCAGRGWCFYGTGCGHSQCAGGGWCGCGTRAFRVRGGFCPGPLAKLRGSCSGSGNTAVEAARPAGGIASASAQAETADEERGGSGRRLQIFRPRLHFSLKILRPHLHLSLRVWRTGSRNDSGKPEWVKYTVVGCASSRRGRRTLAAPAIYERAREAHTGSPFPGALGIHLRAAEGEPLPLLSHYHGRPSNVEDMYDSLSQALTIRDRSFLTRVSLGQGASSRYLPGGSSSVYGLNRLERPEEMLAPTPFQPKLPMYPEPEQRPKLMVDASTTTDNAADQWSEWLRSARQGRSLREWGILAEDLVMAIKYLSEAHPVVTNGRWSNAGRRKAQPPNVLGMLGYLKEALRCVDNFDKAPSGYRGLIFGPTALVFERPASSTQADEAESWKYITASMAVRVQRLVDAKRRKAQAVSEHTAVFLQTAKSAPRPRPRLSPERGAERVVQSPTTPAESGASSGSDSSEVSGVSGESQLEGEGVAEAIGVIRSCQDKGESLWTPGVVCRLFETPELPPNVFPEVTKAMEEQAGSAGHVAAPDAAAASTDVAAGAAVVPPTPRTEAKSLSSLPSVIFRPGRLIQKTLMIEAADGSSVPAPPAIPTRHPLPQPPPAPLNQGSPNLGQTRAEREFVLPKPTSVAQSSSEAQFEDYESVVEAARAAVESASQQL